MTVYRYNPDTDTVEEVAGTNKRDDRGKQVQVRFQPFVSHQLHKDDAKALGLKRTSSGGTVIPTEAALNRYLDREKGLGRNTGWKDW